MNMRNNKRRNVLTHAQVNFSQSEASSLLRGEGGLKFELLLWGELTEKIRFTSEPKFGECPVTSVEEAN